MAAYGSTAGALALLPNGFTVDGSSDPSTSEVDTIVDAVSGEIDAVLSASGYATPVTAPATYLLHLAHVNNVGTVGQVLAVIVTPDPREESPAKVWLDLYAKYLDAIRSGDGVPADLALSGDAAAVYGYGARRGTEDLTPWFRRQQGSPGDEPF